MKKREMKRRIEDLERQVKQLQEDVRMLQSAAIAPTSLPGYWPCPDSSAATPAMPPYIITCDNAFNGAVEEILTEYKDAWRALA